jgi:hypothetical protein
MFITSITSVLFATLLAGQSATAKKPAKDASDLPVATATFPAFGLSLGLGITGTIEFHGLASSNVEIISTATTGLHNFPAGLGPFLYHSISPLRRARLTR